MIKKYYSINFIKNRKCGNCKELSPKYIKNNKYILNYIIKNLIITNLSF